MSRCYLPTIPRDIRRAKTRTTDGTTAIEALEKGLKDLQDLCDVVTDKFTVAKEEFASRMQTDS